MSQNPRPSWVLWLLGITIIAMMGWLFWRGGG